jgi:hypothetical protein
MLTIIENEDQIRASQIQFMKLMNTMVTDRGNVMVGYKGESMEHEVFWSDKLKVWWIFSESENRFWNAFGVGEPRWNTKYSHSITCEINPPYTGINRRVSGLFAKDFAGNVFLLHRGKIGGGRKGIGKTTFQNNYTGEWVDVVEGNAVSEVALIGCLSSSRFPWQVANFVYDVDRIKGISSRASEPEPFPSSEFSKEFSGVKKVSMSNEEILAKCDHGLIVNTLADILKKLGLKVGNTKNIDLYVLDKQKKHLAHFEIKTSMTFGDCYGAIGQLLYHSVKLHEKPKLFAVFPEGIAKEFVDVMEELGIIYVPYSWSNDYPDFGNINFKLLI